MLVTESIIDDLFPAWGGGVSRRNIKLGVENISLSRV